MKRLLLLLLFLVSCLALIPGARTFGAEAKVFKAGAAAVDITPVVFDSPTVGNGYTNIADKVRDPLYARCLILDDGKEQIVFLVIDVCLFTEALDNAMKALIVKKTGIPKDRIMISATHTHSAPGLKIKPSEGETRFTIDNATSAVVKAKENLAPAKIGWAVGNDPKNVFCRRHLMREGKATQNPGMPGRDRVQMNPRTGDPNIVGPSAPVDSRIPILSVVSPDGKPIAVFANYSSHHASSGLARDEISGDRFGVFAEEIKRRIAEKIGKDKMSDRFVGIMTHGTGGDTNCRNYLDPARKYDYFSVGRDNAAAAMAVWPNIEYFDWVPLKMSTKRLTLDCHKPTPVEIQAAKDFVANPKSPKTGTLANSVRSIAQAEKWPKTKDVNLQAMRIGELGVVTLPGEFFSATGIDLRIRSPFKPTITVALANGTHSYVPPPEQFELGGYEVWRSSYRCLGIDAEPRIQDALIEMLNAMRD